ncbi:MAG: alpha amylase N-terminal ig-like domain-containing protein, partial [Planctomycetota bacterium]
GEAIFHDQSPVYCSPLEPQPGDTLTLRLRARAGDLTAATVRVWDTGLNGGAGGEVLVPMWVEAQVGPQGSFDLWRADLAVGSDTLWYRFKLEDQGCEDWYQVTGTIDQPTLAIRDFQVRPGFEGPAWARGAVGYQVFPDRFMNGDPSNDPQDGEWELTPGVGITAHASWDELPSGNDDFFGGDLAGVWQRRDYLSRLGVEFIWFNPVFESRSNHRYDATSYDRIDPHLGTNAGFEAMVRGLERQGIRVILDGVLNHCSSWSEWFDRYEVYPWLGAHEDPQASPFGDWFTFLPGFDHAMNPEAYCSWFAINSLPKLDFGNPEVRDRMVRDPDSVLRGWLATGIGGWRLDAAEDVGPGCDGDDHSVWREMRDLLKADDPDVLLVLEEWSDALPWLEGDQFDAVMDYQGFLFPVQDYCLYRNDSVATFRDRLLRGLRAYPATANHSSWHQLGTHDTSRALTRAGGDVDRVREATFLQFTVPGVPVIYYGDEIGTLGGADPDNRRTFDWDRGNWEMDLLRLTARLAQLRRQSPALREGSFDPYWVHHAGRVLVFAREHQADLLIAVAGSNDAPVDMRIPVERYVADGAVLEDLLGGPSYTVSAGHIDLTGAASLEPHGMRLLRVR